MSIEDVDYDAPAKKKKKGSGLSMKQIKRRLDKIGTMADAKKAKSAQRRLSSAVLAGIAEGKFPDPRKVASMVVAYSGEAGKATAGSAQRDVETDSDD
jgi:hypothetical protein